MSDEASRHHRVSAAQRAALAAFSHRGHARPPFAESPRPGQESVWDYPRPPRAIRDTRHVAVELLGARIAETRESIRILETSHPPTFYLPIESVAPGVLVPAGSGSVCEWKGRASYFDVVAHFERRARAAWSYPDPLPGLEILRDRVSFYPGLLACYVEGERVRPQPGGFYGGWITPDVVGPFKGGPGTSAW